MTAKVELYEGNIFVSSLHKADEIGSRRQNNALFSSKWRRERGSSPKSEVSGLKLTTRKGLVAKKWGFRQKMTTRMDLVAKKVNFSAQNGDENGVRRQNSKFFGSKWRRERGFVAKK
ncbi:hypothetical protein [Caldibacillus thermoamylovorans]|uniref:hypothetical protein n=1 Tax=Caldibacillus thermoamylovorans TaxID=35841 RepID=UPI00203FBA30|nr:hypothetical protein [Caldibacillus thermoamylovorans]MCM3476475.1 hypothetical protein [Caldibacillus thermoamylovorans]